MAAAVVVLVVIVEKRPGSALHDYMFMREHLIDAHMLALAFGISGTASLVRGGMRGVRVRPDWVEYRDVISSVWPKVKKFRWAQIDQITFEPSGSISVDLWDGRREFLPKVDDQSERLAARSSASPWHAPSRSLGQTASTTLDDLDEPFDAEEGE